MDDQPRLILHIGSQKTGTTTLQGFLKRQTKPLAKAGFHYIKAGRTNIAHNSIIQLIRKGQGLDVAQQILDEISEHSDKTCFISSEMFFRSEMAQYFAEHLPPALRLKTRVIIYLRRQDKYAEAMYKQRVKNGRYQNTPENYAANVVNLDYGKVLADFAASFGTRNVIVRPFERALFPNSDVLYDFAKHTTIPEELVAEYSFPSANGTLSREVSEQLGVLNRSAERINTREIIRYIASHRPEGATRTADCLDLATRRQIMATHAAGNEDVRATYCPELPALFDLADLFSDSSYPMPDKAERALRQKQATAAIEQALAFMNQPIESN